MSSVTRVVSSSQLETRNSPTKFNIHSTLARLGRLPPFRILRHKPSTLTFSLVCCLRANRKEYKFGIKLRALLLTTIPDSTSQKFILLGSLSKKDAGDGDRHAVIFLDFAQMRTHKCQEKDLEKWFARPQGSECLMGHKVCIGTNLDRAEGSADLGPSPF